MQEYVGEKIENIKEKILDTDYTDRSCRGKVFLSSAGKFFTTRT